MTTIFRRFLIAGLLLVSIFALLSFGIFGVSRSSGDFAGFGFDYFVMHAGGRAWLAGLNPYDQTVLQQIEPRVQDAPFSYPPLSAALFVPLALLSFSGAGVAWLIVNLLAIATVIAATVYLMRHVEPEHGDKIGLWVLIAFAIGSPLTTNVVWQGQTTLVSLAATMGAWIFSRQNRWVLAGICLALALIKPQIVMLVLVWFLLERQWKLLGASVLAIAVMSLQPMLARGVVATWQEWLVRLQTHSGYFANAPGAEFTIGIRNLAYAAGFPIPSLELVGIGLVCLLWVFRDRFQVADILSLLLAATLLFVFNVDSAYVCLIPVLISLWMHHYRRPWVLPSIALLVFAFLFPRRIVRDFHLPVLNHWRTVVVVIFLILLARLSFAARTEQPTLANPQSAEQLIGSKPD